MNKIVYTIMTAIVAFSIVLSVALYAKNEADREDAAKSIATLSYQAAFQEQVAKNWKEAYDNKPTVSATPETLVILPTQTKISAPLPTLSLSEPTQTQVPAIVPFAAPVQHDYSSIPSDATAACNDGTFYFRHDYKHVCQGHGGYWWWKYEGCTKDSC